ncbi:MAG: Serine phosphatase RsbU, regulator of sigma subunit [Candidatus Ozemobacter sibiricus]|jgi:sigma-B regulation protein RsbU (phosphoserine phosphatase)|uniref:Serine phosphatase RsbU, regulator of sigma subunit n=1 Tax=Candidatus Ozemobacter sibiricus TaxID=2268124 RepID=A0A367ZTJ3_9BACT|nr:MAG: Serine phosphatase RsbU, regulator of sigma subunit [Candidatus Ozemobacter sibiricus]
MASAFDLDRLLGMVSPSAPNCADIIRTLLDLKADQEDQALSQHLLTDLVLRYAEAERRLIRLNAELREKQERLDADLQAAAVIQQALLPKAWPDRGPVRAAWKFAPCDRIGGDVFLLTPLGSRFLMMAVVDISGHGVPSAMVTVSVCQFLQPQSGVVWQPGAAPDGTAVPPAQVLTALDREFPYRRFKKTLSIFYGLLDVTTGQFAYANAGHPPPFLQRPDGTIARLDAHGPIIGMGLGESFPEERVELVAGSRLTAFSDGLTECRNAAGELFGEERLADLLIAARDLPLRDLPTRIWDTAAQFVGQRGFPDDFTLVHLEYRGRE